jgi:hypothetical protein
MKKLLPLLLLTNSAFALLPPLYESIAQLQTLLDQKLPLESAEVIESITKTDEGYLIKTNYSSLNAVITPLPQSKPGPAKYEIRFEKPN